jgi:triphosphoribosyl-dephospho-CoA synthetase
MSWKSYVQANNHFSPVIHFRRLRKSVSVKKLLNNNRKLIFLMTMLLSAVIVIPSLVLAAQTDATTAISSAKEQIITCYQAVRDAEGAGANITSLTAILNDAGVLLSRAELAYSMNNFDAARDFAVQSREGLADCISEANALKETAVQQRSQDFMVNVVGSVVGTFVVLGASAAVWFFLRRRYEQSGVRASESSGV